MTGLELITPPAVEPLMLAEVKDMLKIEHGEEDALLDRLIRVARQRCEQATGRAMISQGWRLWLDRWPGPVVELPNAPLLAVTAVATIGAGDAEEAVPVGLYTVDTARAPGRIIRRSGAGWPAPGRRYNGIRIDYQAGHGLGWNDVPEALRQGMLHMVAHLYEGREEASAALPPVVAGLWQPYRLVRL